jgi:arsenate reductase
MAEALLRALGGDAFDAESAGTETRALHPFAIQAMAEVGIDISLQESKTLDGFIDQRFDLAVTVCDDAAEACPVFPNAAERRHWSLPDPSRVVGDDEHRFAAFVRVRDSIRERIENELLRARRAA